MLLSPGHSPRQISTPPSASTLPTHRPTPSSSSTAFNPRKRGAAVLDEESYVAAIQRIIERDFFPDIPKLRDRLDWLEAVRSGDPVLIRDAQLKIIERRAAAARGSGAATATATARRSRTRTPGWSFFPSFSATPFGSTPSTRRASSDHAAQTAPDDPLADIDTSLSLDDFLLRHTSEDNESFSKILEKANRKRRVKYAHLLEGEKEPALLTLEKEKRDRITDGYGTPGQPVKAHSLAREAARKARERSKMFKKPPLPSPARGGSASQSVRTLSPAAQIFVRRAIALASRFPPSRPGCASPWSCRLPFSP